MYNYLVPWRETAPGVAFTLQKLGPWRPHRTGRQGRLPSSRASPRREFLGYHFHYRHIHIAQAKFSQKPVRMELMRLVGVLTVGVPQSAARAMVVAGMAMAPAHAGVQNELKMISGYCNEVLFQIAHGVNGNTGQAGNIIFIASLFTPIHTAGKGVESITFGVSVWGRPPEIGANSLPR